MTANDTPSHDTSSTGSTEPATAPYDVVVVGAGPAGEVLAGRCAAGDLGLETVGLEPGRPVPGRDPAASSDHAAVPRVTFPDPQLAAVGLTEAAARETGIDVRVVSCATNGVAGASVLGRDIAGTCQVVIDDTRGVVVGATFVGPGIQELLHSATVAVAGEVPLERLWHAVPSFPTVSEVWLQLLEAYGLWTP